MTTTLRFFQPLLAPFFVFAGIAAAPPESRNVAPATKVFSLRIVPPAEIGIDLEKMSFADVSALIDGVPESGELVLPLPFPGDTSFDPIEIRECLAMVDPVKGTIVLGGSARVGKYGAKVFLAGTYAGASYGQYVYGVRPDELRLGNWLPFLESTPLGGLVYTDLAFVIATAPHKLPPSRLVADVLGIKEADKALELKAGVSLRSELAVQSVPMVRDLLAGLGIEQAGLKLSGRLGTSVDILVAASEKKPKIPLEIELRAELEATAMKGLQSQLPPWIKPTSLAPSIELTAKAVTGKPTELGIAVAFDAKVDLGRESIGVKLTSKLGVDVDLKSKTPPKDGEKPPASTDSRLKKTTVVFSGDIHDWERPLGIDWLTLKKAEVKLTVDNTSPDSKSKEDKKGKESGAVELTSVIKIGSKEATLSLEVKAEKSETVTPSAKWTAELDSLALADLADFVATTTGSSFVDDLELGDAQLAGMKLEIEVSKKKNVLTNEITITATAGVGGAIADVLFTGSAKVTGKSPDKGKAASAAKGAAKGKTDVDLEAFFAIRRRGGMLSDLAAGVAGKPGDMQVPASVWTLKPISAGDQKEKLKKMSSADLEPVVREFYEPVYGKGEFQIALTPGIHFGAAIPVAKMPPALVTALDIQDASASLVLEGSLDMSFDFAKGKPSAAVKALDLHAELPRSTGKNAKLPEGLPAWMRAETSSQRTLTVRYAAPSSVTFVMTNDVLADIDGATRNFRIATELSADPKQGSAALSGTMVGEWKQPFGLRGLNLRDVTLAVEASAEKGRGGNRSAALSLAGGFDLGPRSGRMQLELEGASGSGLSGSFTGSLDSFSIDDLTRLDLFPNVPKPGIDRLKETLGGLPPLENPTLSVALGGGKPTASFTATTSINGTRTHLMVFVGKGKSGPQAVVGLRPENLALASLFPRLGQNPTVAPIANLPLQHCGLLAVLGDQTLEASEVPPNVRDFCVAMTGKTDFAVQLSQGLNIEASIPPDQLPQDLQLTLQKLRQSMGQDAPSSGLALRGTLGRNPQEMRLVAALPPLTPARAPKWIKSGQLNLVVTGAPSFQVEAVVVVDCEGDLLNLSVAGGIERQGLNVAMSLKSALQAQDTWDSPFGMEWLEIRRFSGQLSIDAIGNVGLGGGGDVTIGQKDIKVFAWAKINAVTMLPMGLVVEAQSKAGFGLKDLADLQRSMREASGVRGAPVLPLQLLPDIALREAHFKIATRAIPEEDITAGFILKGDLYMPMRPGGPAEKFAFVDCEVGREGIVAKAAIKPLQVGPLTWDDSSFDLEVSPAAQHLRVHGAIMLLGVSSRTDLTLERTGMSFETTREVHELGSTKLLVESSFDLKNPKFHVNGELSNEFGKHLEDSLLGELLDVRGRVAKRRQVLLGAVQTATQAKKDLFATLKLPTAEERLDKIDADLADYKKRMAAALVELNAAKKAMDKAYKAWADAPKPAPKLSLEHIAAKAHHDKLYLVYHVGPLSWVKMLESKERWRATIANVVASQEEFDRVVAESKAVEDRIAGHKGKTWVVRKVTIDLSLTELIALKHGIPVQMTLDMSFCGEPRKVEFPWVIGKPLENARTIVQDVIPAFNAIANEG